MGNFLTSSLKYYYRKLYQRFHYETFKTLLLLGKMQAEHNKVKKHIKSLDEVEFQVFSQRGEDGIIQYITNQLDIPNKIFVEFGVENYTESNTRFLLINNNWAGLVIDNSKLNIRFIKKDFIYWKYDITAFQSFITKENINELIGSYTDLQDIGLLSVDVDGNDYWIWQAIDVIRPRVVVCEYNSIFGPDKKVSVPYSQNFIKTKAHYSNLYYGASLPALCYLAETKGYNFIGTPSAGVNAFFVRKDLSAPFTVYQPNEGFHESANRDSRDKNGNLSFLPHDKRLPVIKELPVIEVSSGKLHFIKDLYNL
jgi:hypothetical protein